jgi:hypothetical protein
MMTRSIQRRLTMPSRAEDPRAPADIDIRTLTDRELDGVTGGQMAKTGAQAVRTIVQTANEIGTTLIVFFEIAGRHQRDPWA